ncbi:MAG: baseplate J/gp47 family protein [Oscillospiraceae bacterium]|nr:baseplate J/gp47 family protein [Oscillospiraceae bacterium]
MSYEYNPPPFLGESADKIHARMLEHLPQDIDKTEGQIPWDFTRPAALEKAQLMDVQFNETIRLMFPHWANDEWLDYHADLEGMNRRPASHATGYVTVVGVPGTAIVQGTQFATAQEHNPSVFFETTKDAILGAVLNDAQGQPALGLQFTDFDDIAAYQFSINAATKQFTLYRNDEPVTTLPFTGTDEVQALIEAFEQHLSLVATANEPEQTQARAALNQAKEDLFETRAELNALKQTEGGVAQSVEQVNQINSLTIQLNAAQESFDEAVQALASSQQPDVKPCNSLPFTWQDMREERAPCALAATEVMPFGTMIPVRAVESGSIGNVRGDMIKLMARPISAVRFITNQDSTYGGIPAESDDELRARLLDMKRRGISWTGNDADYVRWAMEVPGVGSAYVQAPPGEGIDAGQVRLFIIDGFRNPAPPEMREEVHRHIMGPGYGDSAACSGIAFDPERDDFVKCSDCRHTNHCMRRRAPIGATLFVEAPQQVSIVVSVQAIVEGDKDLLQKRVLENLNATLVNSNVLVDNRVKRAMVSAALAKTQGIINFSLRSLRLSVSPTPAWKGPIPPKICADKGDVMIEPGGFPVFTEVHFKED